MRRLASILAAAMLVAACGAAATTAPEPATTSPAAATPAAASAAPTVAPSPTPTVVSARVTFDGTNCVYTGPTVVPSPAILKLEYAPTPDQEDSSVVWSAIRPDTTRAEIDRVNEDPDFGTVEKAPDFILPASFGAWMGTGSWDVEMQIWLPATGEPYDRYLIGCHAKAATKDERPYFGAILELVAP